MQSLRHYMKMDFQKKFHLIVEYAFDILFAAAPNYNIIIHKWVPNCVL